MADDSVEIDLDIVSKGNAGQTMADLAAQTRAAQAAVDSLKASLAGVQGPQVTVPPWAQGAMGGDTQGAASYATAAGYGGGGMQSGMPAGMAELTSAIRENTSAALGLANSFRAGGSGGMGGGMGGRPGPGSDTGDDTPSYDQDPVQGGLALPSLRRMMFPLRMARMVSSMIGGEMNQAATLMDTMGGQAMGNNPDQLESQQRLTVAKSIPILGSLVGVLDNLAKAADNVKPRLDQISRSLDYVGFQSNTKFEGQAYTAPAAAALDQARGFAGAMQGELVLSAPPQVGDENFEQKMALWQTQNSQALAIKKASGTVAEDQAAIAGLEKRRDSFIKEMGTVNLGDRATPIPIAQAVSSLQARISDLKLGDKAGLGWTSQSHEDQARLDAAMKELGTVADQGLKLNEFDAKSDETIVQAKQREARDISTRNRQVYQDQAANQMTQLKQQEGEIRQTTQAYGGMNSGEQAFALQTVQQWVEGGRNLEMLTDEQKQQLQQLGFGKQIAQAEIQRAEQDPSGGYQYIQAALGQDTLGNNQQQQVDVSGQLAFNLNVDEDKLADRLWEISEGFLKRQEKRRLVEESLKEAKRDAGQAKEQHGMQ